jgi:quinol monooxygenase YgiN
MNEHTSYTHAEWRVTPGREEEFVAAWRALGEAFSALERPPIWGTLLQSETEPTVFYSFGPWVSSEDVAAMRADPIAQAAMKRVIALCESARPGLYRLVAHVDVRAGDA